MRVPLVAGNWKMNTTLEGARGLVSKLRVSLSDIQGVDKVICPPFTSLVTVSSMVEGTDIALGAQDMHWEQKGAYTGEISPAMVKELCQYVIVGHSERRTLFGETNESVNRKLRAAVDVGLIPILCVGESLHEYESGGTRAVIERQISEGLQGISNPLATRLVVAYEPIWAIGTGKASTVENAGLVISGIIRPSIAKLLDQQTALEVRVLYGGSVTGSNASEFFSHAEVDGALVGGASLKADDFTAITKAAAK